MDGGCSYLNNVLIAVPATLAAVGAMMRGRHNSKQIGKVIIALNGGLTQRIETAIVMGMASAATVAQSVTNGNDLATAQRAGGIALRELPVSGASDSPNPAG